MAIAWLGSPIIFNSGTTTGQSPSFTVPNGVTTQMTMLVIVWTTDNNVAQSGDIFAASGPTNETWTVHPSSNGLGYIECTAAASPPGMYVWTKDVSADDVANAGTKTYSWPLTNTSEEQGLVCLIGDKFTFGQYQVVGNTNTGSLVCPSLTTTTADEEYFYIAAKDTGAVFTGFPAGTQFLSAATGATSAAGGGYGGVRNTKATPGATGTGTFTLSATNTDGGTFTLIPVPLGPTATGSGTFGAITGDSSGWFGFPTIAENLYDSTGTPLPIGTAVYAYDNTTHALVGNGTIASGGYIEIQILGGGDAYLVVDPDDAGMNAETLCTLVITPTIM